MKNKMLKLYLGLGLLMISISMSSCGSKKPATVSDTDRSLEVKTIDEESNEAEENMEESENESPTPVISDEVKNTDEESNEAEESTEESEESTGESEIESTTPVVSDEKNSQEQVIYPTQVSYTDASGNVTSSYFQDGACIIDSHGNTYEYMTDSMGNKVYGLDITELAGYGDLHEEGDRVLLNVSEYMKPLLLSDNQGDFSSQYMYDEKNRIVKRVDSDGFVLSYSYNDMADGAMFTEWSMIDQTGAGNKGEIEIDSEGNLMRCFWKSIDGTLLEDTKFSYNNKRISMIVITENQKPPYGSGEDYIETHSYTYDADGNEITYCNDDERTEYEGYDENGNYAIRRIYKEDELQVAFFYEYDDYGNLIKENMVLGLGERALECQREEDGRIKSISVDGTVLYEFEFNENNSLKSVKYVSPYVAEEFERGLDLNRYWGTPLDDDLYDIVREEISRYTGIEIESTDNNIDFIYE